jgi:predicted dehydrogenase
MADATQTGSANRRDFLKAGAAGTAAALALGPSLSAKAFADGQGVIKVGLVGCGGRGTGAAAQALNADPGARLVAMGDTFSSELEKSLKNLQTTHADKIQIDDGHKFVGFDAYKGVVDSCDVVLLATPPHFRPEHLAYAVEKGKHIFCEKPVAVDGPGLRSVMESCKKAQEKKLSLVSGLCWRYHPAVKAAFNEILSGRIGDIVAARCSYFAHQLNYSPRQPDWSDMEWQVRDWQWFTWLSGDHIVEQHVHSIDKVVWAMGGKHPVSATGTGGRLLREPGRGDVYDHFAIEYVFDDGVTAFGRCRQQDPCLVDVTDTIYGTKGKLQVSSSRVQITGENPWRYRGEDGDMYQLEHNALFKSIRDAQPINNGDYMTTSTAMAILGREAAYTGQQVKWDELLASEVRLGPTKYEWGSVPTPEVRKPGDQPARPIA